MANRECRNSPPKDSPARPYVSSRVSFLFVETRKPRASRTRSRVIVRRDRVCTIVCVFVQPRVYVRANPRGFARAACNRSNKVFSATLGLKLSRYSARDGSARFPDFRPVSQLIIAVLVNLVSKLRTDPRLANKSRHVPVESVAFSEALPNLARPRKYKHTTL